LAKILNTGDWHFKESGAFMAWKVYEENGLTKELNNILKGIEFVADTIRAEKPDLVTVAGDILHVPQYQTARVLVAVTRAFDIVFTACEEVGADLVIMKGNHDSLNENMNIHSLMPFKKYGTLVDSKSEIWTKGKTKVGLLPFLPEAEFYQEVLRLEKQCDVVVTHYDFDGCSYESGQRKEGGVGTERECVFLASDIHLPQVVNQVHYAGSLVQNRFNRDNLDKVGGCSIYDTKTKEYRHLPNTYSKHYVRIKDINKLPLFDHSKAIFQIFTDTSKEEIIKAYPDLEFQVLPPKKEVSDVKVSYEDSDIPKPKEMLLGHIKAEEPEYHAIIEEIL
jgi:predicted phosphodiesterase